MYSIVMNYLVTPNIVDEYNSSRESTLIYEGTDYKLHIVYTINQRHRSKVIGHYVIEAQTLDRSYEIASLLRSFYSLFYNWTYPSDGFLIHEIDCIPTGIINSDDLTKIIVNSNDYYIDLKLSNLSSGVQVWTDEPVADFIHFLDKVDTQRNIAESLDLLHHSTEIVCGMMDGSYYHLHYKREKECEDPKYDRKLYLENRYFNELAFVSAFKSLERLYECNNLSRKTLENDLARLEIEIDYHNESYQRYHEIFSGYSEYPTYIELIRHFLDMRNAAAAHGNMKVPKKFEISLDSVMEIQKFMIELLSRVIFNDVAVN